jgi:hypothetical protein
VSSDLAGWPPTTCINLGTLVLRPNLESLTSHLDLFSFHHTCGSWLPISYTAISTIFILVLSLHAMQVETSAAHGGVLTFASHSISSFGTNADRVFFPDQQIISAPNALQTYNCNPTKFSTPNSTYLFLDCAHTVLHSHCLYVKSQ